MIGMMEFQIRLIVSILVPSTVNYLLKKKKKNCIKMFLNLSTVPDRCDAAIVKG